MRTPRRVSAGRSHVLEGVRSLPPVAAVTVDVAGVGAPAERREIEEHEAGEEGENDKDRIHRGLPFTGAAGRVAARRRGRWARKGSRRTGRGKDVG